MGLDTKHSVESDYLHAIIRGEFELEDAKRTFLHILRLLEEFDLGKALLDGRAITGEPLVIERFIFGEFVAEAILKSCRSRGLAANSPQFAFVLTVPVLEEDRLGETVAVNRGANAKVFDNPEEAVEWLEITAKH